MKDETRALAAEYAVLVNKYCEAFCQKHGWAYERDGWVGNRVGGMLEVCGGYVDFEDIRTDIDEDFDASLFPEWHRYDDELTALGCTKRVNYRSFAMGCPLPYSRERLDEIKKARQRVVEAEQALKILIDT